MFNYFLPGVDTSQLSDVAWARKFAQLNNIRKREAEAGPMNNYR